MDDFFLIVEAGERRDLSVHAKSVQAENLLNGPTVSPAGVENMVVKAETKVQTWFLPSTCTVLIYSGERC